MDGPIAPPLPRAVAAWQGQVASGPSAAWTGRERLPCRGPWWPGGVSCWHHCHSCVFQPCCHTCKRDVSDSSELTRWGVKKGGSEAAVMCGARSPGGGEDGGTAVCLLRHLVRGRARDGVGAGSGLWPTLSWPVPKAWIQPRRPQLSLPEVRAVPGSFLPCQRGASPPAPRVLPVTL